MLTWAWRSVVAERGALLASAAGIGLALLLAIVVEGIFAGEADQIVAYPQRAGADVWVMQEGVANMHMASSFVNVARAADVERVEGVASVDDVLYVNGFLETAAGEEWFVYIVGVRTGSARGGPWDLAEGEARPGPGEAVLPAVIARRSGLALGATVSVADVELRTVGLSRGTYSMANPVVFVHRDDLAGILSAGGSTSYLLVEAEAGQDPDALAARIDAEVSGVDAMTRADFVASDRAMAMHMGADVIALMSGVGTTVAALLVAFAVYAATLRRRRELAVAMALGSSRRGVLEAVLLQSVLITAVGYGFAVALALGLRPALAALLPEVTVLFVPATLLQLGLLAGGVAVVAAAVPGWRVAGTDPAEAFRA